MELNFQFIGVVLRLEQGTKRLTAHGQKLQPSFSFCTLMCFSIFKEGVAYVTIFSYGRESELQGINEEFDRLSSSCRTA